MEKHPAWIPPLVFAIFIYSFYRFLQAVLTGEVLVISRATSSQHLINITESPGSFYSHTIIYLIMGALCLFVVFKKDKKKKEEVDLSLYTIC